MSDVEFSEEVAYKNEVLKRAQAKGEISSSLLLNFPIRLGLAKDQTGANIILGIIGILATLAAVLVFLIAL